MSDETEITVSGEFASTMQQLVAEAAKKIAVPQKPGTKSGKDYDNSAALHERFDALERLIATKLAKPATDEAVPDMLQRIDDHLIAIRKTETTNQRLFNSLHDELKNYRDNFLRESLQKPFIRDLIILLDDLSSIASQMDGAAIASGPVMQWKRNLENASHSLVEILHRMEVSEIEPKDRVDRKLHKVMSYEPADFAEDDGLIVLRMKRGYLWRNQVLRMEEVVAKRFD